MNKFWFSFWMAALLLGVSGCGGPAFIAGADHPVKEKAENEALLYRGTLVSVTETGSGQVLRLEQAEGTAYGDPQMEFLLTAESALSFEPGELEEGVYLEVYYNGKAEVLSAKLHHSAEIVVFNGTVSFVRQDGEGKGHMLLTRDGSGEEAVFRYHEDTQFFFPREELKEGVSVSIFHSGIMTRSLPPQCNALEVRYQAAACTGEGD